MKTPECGNCGGCPGAASCPFIASIRERVPGLSTLSVLSEKPSITSGVGEIINFQEYKNRRFFGRPVKEDSGCTCGFCSECKKKKVAA